MKKKNILLKTLSSLSIVAATSTTIISCSKEEKENVVTVTNQNLSSSSVELFFKNSDGSLFELNSEEYQFEYRKFDGEDEFTELNLNLLTKTTDIQKNEDNTTNKTHTSRGFAKIKISNLEEETKYEIRLSKQSPTGFKELKLGVNNFKTSKKPEIKNGSLKVVLGEDSSKQIKVSFEFNNPQEYVQKSFLVSYQKLNSENKAIESNLTSEVVTYENPDSSLVLELNNLNKNTKYKILKIWETDNNKTKIKQLIFEQQILPFEIKTNGDVVEITQNLSKVSTQDNTGVRKPEIYLDVKFANNLKPNTIYKAILRRWDNQEGDYFKIKGTEEFMEVEAEIVDNGEKEVTFAFKNADNNQKIQKNDEYRLIKILENGVELIINEQLKETNLSFLVK